MKQFTYIIQDPVGLHARPAGLLVKEAARFAADISIECRGKTVGAKKLFGVMGLGVKGGDTVTIATSGDDEEAAVQALAEFLNAGGY